MGRGARIALWVGAAVVTVCLLAVAGFLVWASTPLGPAPEALEALASDELVAVEDVGSAWEFSPRAIEATAGVVLYPGGRVDVRSYAPLARDLAEAGFFVAVPKAPLSLAILDTGAAADVIASHPGIGTWIVGGHSLGGASAMIWLGATPDAPVDGVALLAAYPPEGSDLSERSIPAATIRGSEDGLVSPADIEDSLLRMPPATDVVVIDGGNHAQFGSYGPQDGDNPASIPASDQRAQTVEAVRRVAGDALAE